MGAASSDTSDTVHTRPTLREIAGLFLKLGTVAFGGPAAHIAMMEDEVVRRRQWLTREEFLDYLGATNLIPGPNSTELAIHIGHAQGGWPGLLVAGICFILPAALFVGCIAWAYVRFGTLPAIHGVLYGVKPVVIVVILQALWRLGRSAVNNVRLALVGVAALLCVLVGVNELLILAGAGLATVIWTRLSQGQRGAHRIAPLVAAIGPHSPHVTSETASALTTLGSGAAVSAGLWPLFGVFVKAGAVLFGSGYVLLAFLRADLVQRYGWLTEQQLLDAVAIGQITPGPVFTTATFIGYLLGRGPGALVATCGIFLPAFFFVAISGPLLPRLRRSATARAVLDGVNVASLALLVAVLWELGHTAFVDPLTIILGLASALAVLRFGVQPALITVGGALVGLIAYLR